MKYLRFSAALLPALTILACGRDRPEAGVAGPPQQLAAHRVAETAGSARYAAAGAVRAVRRAELATRLIGTIGSVQVRAGDRVAAGQLVLTLDARSPQAGMAQARAALEHATLTLRRMERLLADSAISQAQLDAARAAHSQADAQLRAAQADVGYAGLRAPFAGLVTARLADPGDLAVPGQALLVIESDAKEIVVGVPDDLLDGICTGLVVPVRIGASERRVDARITAVVPVADPASRTAEVRLSAPEELTSGASAIAELPVGAEGGPELRIPERTLIRRGQLVGVLVFATDSTLRLRWIRLGRIAEGTAEVLAGLSPGDLIALAPNSLQDGMRALPRPEATAR